MNPIFKACACVMLACAVSRPVEIEFSFDDSSGTDAVLSALIKGAEEAHRLNAEGITALDKDRFDEAAGLFQKAAALLPGYTDALNNIGVVYFRRGMPAQAREVWTDVLKKEPSYAIPRHNLAILYYHEKKYDQALEQVELALKSNRQFAEACLLAGRIEARLGHPAKALDFSGRAYRIAPKNENIWSYHAFLLIQNGDTTAAESVLRQNPEHREALRQLGMIALGRGNVPLATDLLSRSVEKGGSTELLIDIASAAVESRRYADALTVLDRYFLLRKNPSADAFLYAGIAAKEKGDLKSAHRYFESGLERFPGDAIIRYNFGQILFFQKNYAGAEEAWTLLSDSLSDPSLYYLRALSLYRGGNYTLAETMIRKALKMDEKAEYLDMLGVLLYRTGEKEKAIEQFKKALKINPDLRSAQLNLSMAGRSPDEIESSIRQTRAGLDTCRTDCDGMAYQLSILYYHQKQYQQAIATLEKIPEKERDERIYRHIALLHRELHDWDKSAAVLEQAKKRFVLDVQTEYELAETYLLGGYYARAIAAFSDLRDRWTSNPWRLYYQLGYAYMELNNLERAADFFSMSMKSKQVNPAAAGLLAFVYNRQGKHDEARGLWLKSSSSDPTNPAVQVNLGLSFEKDGDFARALEYYGRAVSLAPDDKLLQLNVGNAYAGLNRTAEAFSAYGIALNSSKRDCAAYNIYLLAVKARLKARAEEMAGILQKEFPSSPYTMRILADLRAEKGDTAAAVDILNKIRDKDPGDWLNLARLHGLSGRDTEAAAALKNVPDEPAYRQAIIDTRAQMAFTRGDCAQALALWSSAADTSFVFRYNMALAAYRCRRYAEAADICEKLAVSASGVDRADVCRLAGNAAFGLKQWDRARRWYLQLSGMEARDAVVRYNLAVACYNLKEYDKSYEYYTAAKKLDPSIYNKDIEGRNARAGGGAEPGSVPVIGSIDSLYNVAIELQEHANDEEAERIYRRIIVADPVYAPAWNNLGALYAAKGIVDSAEAFYRKAIDKRHDLPEAYANLVTLYTALEDYKQAKRWIIKGKGHNPDSELLVQAEAALEDSIRAFDARAGSEP